MSIFISLIVASVLGALIDPCPPASQLPQSNPLAGP